MGGGRGGQGRGCQDWCLNWCGHPRPDVILLGEMRDLETISAAIAAPETGHFEIIRFLLVTFRSSQITFEPVALQGTWNSSGPWAVP